MAKFVIGGTVGLECNGHGMMGKMVRVEFTRIEEGGAVTLQAINGRNLADLKGTTTITAESFSNRPDGDVEKARWALKHCGWTLMSDEQDAE